MKAPAKSVLGKKYGWRPPPDDHHLLKLAKSVELSGAPVPASVDHRPLLTPVRDQGQEGSCFAHSTGAMKEHDCAVWGIAQGQAPAPLGGYLSVAYVSWRTRLAMGTFPEDSGASIADAMAILHAWGVPPETWLPYNQNPAEAGNAGSDVGAIPYRCGVPATVPINPDAWRQVLAAGKCINIGFEVHQSFEETRADGLVPDVKSGEGSLGGHAVLVVGYDSRGFLIRNSWGSMWADGGYCVFPESYLSNVFEAWTTT